MHCVQVNALAIKWYNPQGQLVSRGSEDVRQGAVSSEATYLIFASYHESQSGKYECRVTLPGNNSEKLSVCVGEAKPCVTTATLT